MNVLPPEDESASLQYYLDNPSFYYSRLPEYDPLYDPPTTSANPRYDRWGRPLAVSGGTSRFCRKYVTRRFLFRSGLVSCLLILLVNFRLSKYLFDRGPLLPMPITTPDPQIYVNFVKAFEANLSSVGATATLKPFLAVGEDVKPELKAYGASSRLYPKFQLTPPAFPSADEAYKQLFMKNKRNKADLERVAPPAERTGVVAVIPRGVITRNTTCDVTASMTQFLTLPPGARTATLPVLMLLNDEHATCGLETFITDVLPRMAQAKDFVTLTELTLVARGYCPTLVTQMLVMMGLTKRIDFYPSLKVNTYRGEYLVTSCRAPPLHPQLMTEAQTLLEVSAAGDQDQAPTGVTVLLRLSPTAGGRSISNLEVVDAMLKERYTDVTIFEGSTSLKKIRTIFEGHKVFVAVHGPVLYNIIFAPPKSQIIEIFATKSDGSYVTDHPQERINDIWRLAQSLGLRYYRMMEEPSGHGGAVRVNPRNLENMIDTIVSVNDA